MRFCAALLAIALAASATQATPGAEPNNGFNQATVLPVGTMLITDTLTPGLVYHPDTYLGIRNISGLITQVDDNGSIYGNGFASGVQFAATNGTTLAFTVTGAGDNSFKGNHTQEGVYELDVSVTSSTGLPAGFFTERRELHPGVVHEFSFTGNNTWINATYSVNIENRKTEPVNGDVDYYTFTGLKPNVAFTAQSFDPTGGVNMFLYQIDSAGTTIALKDNNGEGPFGNIDEVTGIVPANGQLTFAVTGFGDLDSLSGMPIGEHDENGSYQLRVFQPGPSADFNNNGVVNAQDLAIWRDAFHNKTAAGDADRDFDTDAADFILWQRQLGSTAAVGAISAIPEPTAALIAVIACGLLPAFRKRRARSLGPCL